MGFKRTDALGQPPQYLNEDMVGIGMNIACTPNSRADIERTLVFASALGMEG